MGIFTFITLRPHQNKRKLANDLFNWGFLNKIGYILIEVLHQNWFQCCKNRKPGLVHIMGRHKRGNKLLCWTTMVLCTNPSLYHFTAMILKTLKTLSIRYNLTEKLLFYIRVKQRHQNQLKISILLFCLVPYSKMDSDRLICKGILLIP